MAAQIPRITATTGIFIEFQFGTFFPFFFFFFSTPVQPFGLRLFFKLLWTRKNSPTRPIYHHCLAYVRVIEIRCGRRSFLSRCRKIYRGIYVV
jgi:hypothetical protein